jgi:mRNA deadenylase 3'-5' endonuclease subunit Ccr4
MFVEHLFEINPLTFLLIVISTIYIVFKYTTSKNEFSQNSELINDAPPINFISYKSEDELNSPSTKQNSISIMTYNILAYNFTTPEWFPYCHETVLSPQYRAPRIINEIEKLNFDIVCLQECDYDLFMDFYKPNLEALGYDTKIEIGLSKKKVSICTAYKKSLFREEKYVYLNLNSELEKLDDSFLKHKEAHLFQLKHISSKKSFVLVNTHLFWNPKTEWIKYGQISMITTTIENNFNKSMPTLIAGDFNSTPDSNVVKIFYKKAPQIGNDSEDNIKNRKYIEQFWKEMNEKKLRDYRSAYDVYKVSTVEDNKTYYENHPDYTTYTQEFNGNIDYIFYSSENLELLQLLKIPTHDTEIKGLKIPNYRYPSDHLKVGAKFKLR